MNLNDDISNRIFEIHSTLMDKRFDDMQNYINLILDELQGDTPREKLEALKKLKYENSAYWSKAQLAHTNFSALAESPGCEQIKSILIALANQTKV